MNKKYTKIISTSDPVEWYKFQHINAKNTITLLSNINLFTINLFHVLMFKTVMLLESSSLQGG